MLVLYRLVMLGCSRFGSRSTLGLNPLYARRSEDVVVMTKSGMARWHGNRMPRPPLFVWRWAISWECCGKLSMLSSLLRKELMIWFSSEVRSPSFQVGQSDGS